MALVNRAVRVAICLVWCGPLSLFIVARGRGSIERAFHVSPSGDDGSEGTEARPFATLRRAQQAVARGQPRHDRDIEIVLRGGTYRQERPWCSSRMIQAPAATE